MFDQAFRLRQHNDRQARSASAGSSGGMRLPADQAGIGTLGWIIAIAIFGFCLTVVLKIAPVYMDNMLVKDALVTLNDIPDVDRASPGEIKSKLDKFFAVNGVRTSAPKAVKIKRESGKVLVTIDYEERVDFYGNIDLVITFENHFDSSEAVK